MGDRLTVRNIVVFTQVSRKIYVADEVLQDFCELVLFTDITWDKFL